MLTYFTFARDARIFGLIAAPLLFGAVGCDRAELPIESAMPRVDADRVTVSGVGAGGYMAGQMHVAHSATISGVAIIGAGPYWCAKNSAPRALDVCSRGGDLDVGTLTHFARDQAAAGHIDTLNHLRDDRVWIFHGRNDDTRHADAAWAAAEFYEDLMPEKSVQVIADAGGGDGLPVLAQGYDAALTILTHLLRAGVAPGDRGESVDRLREFDQQLYVDAGFGENGYIYVPEACAGSARCGLHITLHDCEVPQDGNGASVALASGFNEWADAFRTVVLYPQIRNDAGRCWDWWGFTGPNYAVQSGLQIRALKGMIDSLVGETR